MLDSRAAPILSRFGLGPDNPGVCLGPGRWCGGGAAIPSRNPANEMALARVTTASAADLDAAIASAAEAAHAWRAVPAPRRGEAVRQFGELLRANKDALGTLVSLENGKIKSEGDGEVQEMIDIADFAVGQSRMLYGKTMPSERPRHRMLEQWHPLGVVGVITAFNFPVAVWAWNAMLAAVCGNAVVWKPSPKTPLCALAVQSLANRVVETCGLPPVFALVVCDNALARSFVADPRIALVSFTGSSAVGREVAQAVAGRFGKTVLECAGNNAIIVAADADLDLVVPAVLFGAVGTAGQRCTTTRRLFLQRGIAPRITEALVNAYKQVKIGDPLEEATLMGPLVNRRAVDDMLDGLRRIREQGGEVLSGGEHVMGCFVQPTLVRARPEMPILKEEIFAPILYLIEFDDLDQAIHWHNDVPQGLSSAMFTSNLISAETFLSHRGSDCGIANINIGTSGAEIGGAFGGEKDTGGGRESGSDSWKAYMRRQTNTINWSTQLPLAQGIRFAV